MSLQFGIKKIGFVIFLCKLLKKNTAGINAFIKEIFSQCLIILKWL